MPNRLSSIKKLSYSLLLITFVCLLSSRLYADESLEKTTQLKVFSYNIQQMGYPPFITHHFEKQRLYVLPERILEMDVLPDVIVFQEAFLENARQYLLNALSESYPYITEIGGEYCSEEFWSAEAVNCLENLHKSLTHNSGVFILSRWPIEASYSLTFENVRVSYTFDFMARKGAVYARINKQGLVFHLVGTHLQADEKSHDIRMAQLQEIMNWMKTFGLPENEPLLYAGDFNVSSLKTNELNDLLSTTNSSLLLNEGDFSVSSESNTYLRKIYGSQEQKTLDYILLSNQHLQPEKNNSLQVINFKSEKHWKGISLFTGSFESRDISDHYPVSLELNF